MAKEPTLPVDIAPGQTFDLNFGQIVERIILLVTESTPTSLSGVDLLTGKDEILRVENGVVFNRGNWHAYKIDLLARQAAVEFLMRRPLDLEVEAVHLRQRSALMEQRATNYRQRTPELLKKLNVLLVPAE